MSRAPILTIALSFLVPTVAFCIVAAISGARALIPSFLIGLVLMIAAAAAIFFVAANRERNTADRR
jgi:hypothetical protein